MLSKTISKREANRIKSLNYRQKTALMKHTDPDKYKERRASMNIYKKNHRRRKQHNIPEKAMLRWQESIFCTLWQAYEDQEFLKVEYELQIGGILEYVMLESKYLFIHPKNATITKPTAFGEIDIPTKATQAKCACSFMFHENRLYVATTKNVNIQIPATFPYEIVSVKLNPRGEYYRSRISYYTLSPHLHCKDPAVGLENFIQERLGKTTKELLAEIQRKK